MMSNKDKEKALEEAKEITKGASTLEDFKELGGSLVGALQEPGKTAADLNQKAIKALDVTLDGIRDRQKKYHDAAQNLDNSLAERAMNSIRAVFAKSEETTVEDIKHTLKEAHFSHKSAAAEGGVAGLWMGQTGATDYSTDKDKKKEDTGLTSRATSLLGEAGKGAKAVFSAAAGAAAAALGGTPGAAASVEPPTPGKK